MTSLRRNGLILVAMLMLAQPAWAALFGNDEEVTRQMQALQQRVDALDARLAKLEQSIQQNQPMLDMLKEVESLKAEVARLRGQSEVQGSSRRRRGLRKPTRWPNRAATKGRSPCSATPSTPTPSPVSRTFSRPIR